MAFAACCKFDEFRDGHLAEASALQEGVEFLFLRVLLGEVLVGGVETDNVEEARRLGESRIFARRRTQAPVSMWPSSTQRAKRSRRSGMVAACAWILPFLQYSRK